MEQPITEDIAQVVLEGTEIIPVITTSLTYKVDKGRVLGKIDYLEAMKQAVDKILKTDRFIFEIYSWQYGNDLSGLFGKDIPYAQTAVEDILKEALLSDERVKDVNIDDVSQTDRQSLSVKLTVSTLFGDIEMEREVNV